MGNMDLDIKWNPTNSQVRAASEQRGTDSVKDAEMISEGFMPNTLVNVIPASCMADKDNEISENPYHKSASFFYSVKDGQYPYVQEIIKKLNLDVNNPKEFESNFVTGSALYDQLHLFIDEHKVTAEGDSEYTFRVHCRGHAKTQNGNLVGEGCALCLTGAAHNFLQAPQGDETTRMIMRQNEIKNNIEKIFFTKDMVYEAVKKLPNMRNPKYKVDYKWDIGHNGLRWAYADEQGSDLNKRPTFHINGTVKLVIKDLDGLDRLNALGAPGCSQYKPCCCIPGTCGLLNCHGCTCDAESDNWCKQIDRNAGWNTCCGLKDSPATGCFKGLFC